MTIGEKLQKLRAREGLSQDQLAEQLDVSRQAVSKWERDEAVPEAEKLLRVADRFGVTVDSLLRAEAEPTPPPPARRSPGAWLRDRGWLLGVPIAVCGLVMLLYLLTRPLPYLLTLDRVTQVPGLYVGAFLEVYGAYIASALGILAAGVAGAVAGYRRAGRLCWYHGGTLLAMYALAAALGLLALWGASAALNPALLEEWTHFRIALGRELAVDLVLALAGLAIVFLGRRYDRKPAPPPPPAPDPDPADET